MKAVEFIRKVGWEKSIEVVEVGDIGATKYIPAWNFYAAGIVSDDFVLLSELKKYTSAYELVQKHGGIDGAIEETGMSYISASDWDELNIAITLVEEVGECDEND